MKLFEHDHMQDGLLWDVWLSRLYLPAVAVADTLGIFSYINNNLSTVEDISICLNASRKGLKSLLHLLSCLGFIDFSDSLVSLTKIAKIYLLPTSEFYWGFAFVRIHENEDYKKILKAITTQKEQLLFLDNSISQMWINGNVNHVLAKDFTNIMHSTIIQSAYSAINSGEFNGIYNLLDVGGGSGCFSEYFVNLYPKSSATIFELPAICEILTEKIKNNRISLCGGNFFINTLPLNYDGILLSNILHDWPLETVEMILKKCFYALENNGKIFIHEMLLDNRPSAKRIKS